MFTMSGSLLNTTMDDETGSSNTATVKFFACCGYQLGIGQDVNLARCQPTVSRTVSAVTAAINEHLFSQLVLYPLTPLEANQKRILRGKWLPGVAGAIGCTHAAIVSPPQLDQRTTTQSTYSWLATQSCVSYMQMRTTRVAPMTLLYGKITTSNTVSSWHMMTMLALGLLVGVASERLHTTSKCVNGGSLLQTAAALGQENLVDLILKHERNIDQTNDFGWTPLMQATRNGHANIVMKLLACGANITLSNHYGANLLSFAAASNDEATISIIITAMSKTDINFPQSVRILSLLIAVLFGNPVVVKMLLEANCDINMSSTLGITPLMMATVEGNHTLVKYLLSHSANVYISNYLHHTALHIARLNCYDNIVELLGGTTYYSDMSPRKTDSSPGLSMYLISPKSPSVHLQCSSPYQNPTSSINSNPTLNSNTTPRKNVTPLMRYTLQDHYLAGLYHSPSFQNKCTSDAAKPFPEYSKRECPPPYSSLVQRSLFSSPHSVPDPVHDGRFPLGIISPSSRSYQHSQPQLPNLTNKNVLLQDKLSLICSPCKQSTSANFLMNKTKCDEAYSKESGYGSRSDEHQLFASKDSVCAEQHCQPMSASQKLNCASQIKTPCRKVKGSNIQKRWSNFSNKLSKLKSPKYSFSPQAQRFPNPPSLSSPQNMDNNLDLKTLLTRMNLAVYATLFEKHELDVATFLSLNEEDLEEMCIDNQSSRKEIMKKIMYFKKSIIHNT